MFVTPNDKIQKSVKKMFGDVVARSMLRAVLVQRQQVEPLVRFLLRPQHLDLVLAEQSVEPLVFDGTEAVQRELCPALAKQQWRDRNFCNLKNTKFNLPVKLSAVKTFP